MIEKKYIVTGDIFRYLDSKRYTILAKIDGSRTCTVNEPNAIYTIVQYAHLNDLTILTCRFKPNQPLKHSDFLRDIEPFIFQDITNNPRYSDALLHNKEKPVTYNLMRHFETLRAYEPPNLFFWQPPHHLYTHDAIALITYKNHRLFCFYRKNYLNQNSAASLHRLRIVAFRQWTLLKNFQILKSDQNLFCQTHLRSFYDQSKPLRYLYFLAELWEGMQEKTITTIHPIKEALQQSHQKIVDELNQADTIKLIETLEAQLPYPPTKNEKFIEDEAPRLLQKELNHLSHMLHQCNQNKTCNLYELYEQLTITQTIIEELYHFFDHKQTQRLVDTLDILIKPLRLYLNCHYRKELLKLLFPQGPSSRKMLGCDQSTIKQTKHTIQKAIKILAFESLL